MTNGSRILYIEPFSGISGDMFLGALVDLGVPLPFLDEQLRDLDLDGRVTLRARRVGRGGVFGTKVDVVVDGSVDAPHDVESPRPTAGHRGAEHAIPAAEVVERIAAAPLDPDIRDRSLKVFRCLIEAEARVHETDAGHVHLHEVGALDAVADIVCSVAGVSMLEVDSVVSAYPREGHGEAHSAHGTLPVPAPATAYLLEGVPVQRVEVPFELVTPTGAALLVTLVDRFTERVAITAEHVAYGAGSRELAGRPNLLRISVGEEMAGPLAPHEQVLVLETVVDDALPEIWPYLIERLLEAGARDAWLDPVIMKKGRPGIHLTVVTDPQSRSLFERIIFEETGTLGIRASRTDRSLLPRAAGMLRTDLGPLRVKLSRPPGTEGWRVHPEFEACREVARELALPLREVYAAVRRAASRPHALTVEEEERE